LIEIDVTQEIIKDANIRNEHYKKMFGNKGTHRKDKHRQRMTGYLSEASIIKTFPHLSYSVEPSVDFTYGKFTIDSKAQGCNSFPLPHYSATIYEEQKERPVDFYIFSRVKNDQSKVWICGIISKKDFFSWSELIPRGTQNNNFTYDQARYEIKYSQLYDINNFFDKLTFFVDRVW